VPRKDRIDGKTASRIFKALRNGAKLSDVIVRYKVTPRAARLLREQYNKYEAEGKEPEAPSAPEQATPSAYALTVESRILAGDGQEVHELRLVISVELGDKPSKTFDLTSEWYDSESPEGLIISTQNGKE
jgi:hypothetical protein